MKALVGDRRGAGPGDLVQFAAGMRPTVGQPDILRGPFEQPIVARIAIDLQGAREAFEDVLGVLAGSARCIGKRHAGRIVPAPGAVVAGECQEIPRLGLASPRVEHRGRGLVHEQLG